jgi:uncharacterized coiled-coil DUF342 family protein
MADATVAEPKGTDSTESTRPTKPDEAKYKIDLAEAEKKHAAAQKKFQDIRAKIDGTRPGKGGSGNDRYKELLDELKEIRAKQAEGKSARGAQQDKLSTAQDQEKKILAQLKDAQTRIGYKSADEIDRKIKQLDDEVSTGRMAIVDEKKNLAQISQLRKTKKGFPEIDSLQKQLDAKRAEVKEFKGISSNPENKALSTRYDTIQSELNDIKASREEVSKNMDSKRAERDAAHAAQQETFLATRAVKDNYYNQLRAFQTYDREQRDKRFEAQRKEKQAFLLEKREKLLAEKLEVAKEPAFLDEIRTAEGLIVYFDPSAAPKAATAGPGEFAASAQRSVNEEGFKGMKVVSKKEEEDFFPAAGGKKKGKKGGKKAAVAGEDSVPVASGKLNMNVGVIEQLGKLNVDPPSTQADVSNVVEKLQAKLEQWKKDQKTQTEKVCFVFLLGSLSISVTLAPFFHHIASSHATFHHIISPIPYLLPPVAPLPPQTTFLN